MQVLPFPSSNALITQFLSRKWQKMVFTRFGGQVWLSGGQVRQFWGRGSLLCSLLYWVQFVNTKGKVQNYIKTACRAADCMGICSLIPALYGSAEEPALDMFENSIKMTLLMKHTLLALTTALSQRRGTWCWTGYWLWSSPRFQSFVKSLTQTISEIFWEIGMAVKFC